jgi:pyruvate kinase
MTTKIVATIGPASAAPGVLREMLMAGVDVVRVNCSHGTVEGHVSAIAAVRQAATATGRTVAVLLDLQGPKIRVGDLPEPIELVTGQSVVLRAGVRECKDAIPVVYDRFAADLSVGDRVLLHDGLLETIVLDIDHDDVRVQVVRGGLLRSRKGINMPGAAVSALTPTAQDREHLSRLADLADFVALSFVSCAADVLRLRQALTDVGSSAHIVAKLERAEALVELDSILDVVDVVMVARGDLGVEIGPEHVPVAQKRVIAAANARGIPVITATEMLESMITSTRPTRAEASDVANAVFDGTDAVMLSAETASGANPVEAVVYMRRITSTAEAAGEFARPVERSADGSAAAAVARAVRQLVADTGAVAVACFTETGASARLVATSRPGVPVLALTHEDATARRCALYPGVVSSRVPVVHDETALIVVADSRLRASGLAGPGDCVIVVTGVPGRVGATNRVFVHRVGDELLG